MVIFDRQAGNGLHIIIDNASVWAFADFTARRVMVPFTDGAPHSRIIQALSEYWPTCTTIEWPEDLETSTLEV